uniref:Peptidase_M13_N domain-containing protein n=1 Tax=Steinernema glaseri TaxID=37863 RepID=A0A1I7YBE8_9BILA
MWSSAVGCFALCVLCLLPVPATAAPFELDHLFSSTVHPCDDFNEFVCNKKENNGLSPLLREMKDGYFKKIKEAFTKDNDPVLAEFKKRDGATHTVDPYVLRKYIGVLATKYVLELGIIPTQWHQEQMALFEELQEEISQIMENATWVEGRKILRDMEVLADLHGVQPPLEEVVSLINKIGRRFVELKTARNNIWNPEDLLAAYKETMRGHAFIGQIIDEIDPFNAFVNVIWHRGPVLHDEAVIITPISSIPAELLKRISEHFNITMPSQGPNIDLESQLNITDRINEDGGRRYLTKRSEDPDMRAYLPLAAFYKPSTPLSIMLRRYYNMYLFAERLMDLIILKTNLLFDSPLESLQDKCHFSLEEYRDVNHLLATRLAAKMVRERSEESRSTKFGRFTDLQWMFIALEAGRCSEKPPCGGPLDVSLTTSCSQKKKTFVICSLIFSLFKSMWMAVKTAD